MQKMFVVLSKSQIRYEVLLNDINMIEFHFMCWCIDLVGYVD